MTIHSSLDCGVLMMDDFNQNLQFQPQFQFQQQTPQQMMMMMMVPESSSVSPPLPLLAMEPNIETLVEKQSQEIDRYVQQQNSLLRRNIQRCSKQHLASIMRSLESRAALVLKQKDEELAMVENRMLQLEACLKKLEHDKESWENVARENEALAVSLGNALEQLRSPCFSSTGREEEDKGEEEITSSLTKLKRSGGGCRVCGVRGSSMLLLPCRHVCCCEVCDASVDLCPVCSSAKEASVEVFLA